MSTTFNYCPPFLHFFLPSCASSFLFLHSCKSKKCISYTYVQVQQQSRRREGCMHAISAGWGYPSNAMQGKVRSSRSSSCRWKNSLLTWIMRQTRWLIARPWRVHKKEVNIHFERNEIGMQLAQTYTHTHTRTHAHTFLQNYHYNKMESDIRITTIELRKYRLPAERPRERS